VTDVAEKPIIAFREWGFEGRGADIRLAPRHSTFAGGRNPWSEVGTARAFCKHETATLPSLREADADLPHDHRPGGEGCSCGLYGYYDVVPPYLEPVLSHDTPRRMRVRSSTVYGVYVAWGEVTKHRRGLRSQFARVVGLRWSPEAEKLAEVYGVPLCDTPGELRAAGMRYGVMLDPTTLPSRGKQISGLTRQAAMFNSFGAGAGAPITISCILVLGSVTKLTEETGLAMEPRMRVEGIDPNIWRVHHTDIQWDHVEIPIAGTGRIATRPGYRRVELTLITTQPEHKLDRLLSELTKVGTIYRVERGFPPGAGPHGGLWS
jgi:hypothetical protein